MDLRRSRGIDAHFYNVCFGAPPEKCPLAADAEVGLTYGSLGA